MNQRLQTRADVKCLLNVSPAGPSEPIGKTRIMCQTHEGIGELLGLMWLDKQPSLIMNDQIRDPHKSRRDRWQTARHRLHKHLRQTVHIAVLRPHTGQAVNVPGAHECRNGLLCERLSRYVNEVLQTVASDLVAQSALKRPAARNRAAELLSSIAQDSTCVDQNAEALLLDEAAGRQDVNRPLPVVTDRAKREVRDIDSTVDHDKLLGPCAMIQIELPMELRDAHDELRSPDLVRKRASIPEQVRRMPRETEGHFKQPRSIHRYCAAGVNPLRVNVPDLVGGQTANPIASHKQVKDPGQSSANVFPLAKERVARCGYESPRKPERGLSARQYEPQWVDRI